MLRALRFAGVVGLAFWLGGIAFYGGLVIPRAHAILEDHAAVARVTREATATANLIGAAVLALLAWHLAVVWRTLGRGGRIALGASGGVMVLAQAGLFLLHAHLGGLLDASPLHSFDRPRFMPLHERYLNLTTVLMLAGLVHLWAMLPGRPTAPPAA